MQTKKIQFTNKQVIDMAKFISELERQSMRYIICNMCDGWAIEIIGF